MQLRCHLCLRDFHVAHSECGQEREGQQTVSWYVRRLQYTLPQLLAPTAQTHADHVYVGLPSQAWQNDDIGCLLNGDGDAEKESFDEESGPGHAVDYERYQYSSPLRGYFYRIILDEAYNISNSYTKTLKATRRSEPDKEHLITATPMLNKRNDFYSYLTIFWKDEWDVNLAEESINPPI